MHRLRTKIWPLIAIVALCLASCSPPEPLRIGFLGGLSGRVSDLGSSGLNGVRLAIDLRNTAGGIKGQQIELIEADDQQDPEAAIKAFGSLIDRHVAAIIGPMTSAMATATVPLANRAQVVMISPTVTSTDFSTQDDYFFRVIPATSAFVKTSADHYFRTLGLRRIRLVYDLRNRSYTESWLKEFDRAFSAMGGKLLPPLGFTSSDELSFSELLPRILSGTPEGVVLIANSVDAAMLCRDIRKQNPSIVIGTSEWAATERLIELGKKAVEGVSVAQFHDRQDRQPTFVAFRDAYLKRFRQEPGYAGLFAFDAANVIFTALEGKTTDQSLKQALLAHRAFAGAQRKIAFDAHGDTLGETFIVQIKDGAFVPSRPTP